MKNSELIKRLRISYKLTQKDFAKKVGLSVATIQGYEQERYEPKLETLCKIFDSFSLDQYETRILLDPDLRRPIALLYAINNRNAKDISDLISSMPYDYNSGQVMSYYSHLNKKGKREAIKRLWELTQIKEYTDQNALSISDFKQIPKNTKPSVSDSDTTPQQDDHTPPTGSDNDSTEPL